MKIKTWSIALGVFVALGTVMVPVLILYASGIRAVYFNHVIATFEITGLESTDAAVNLASVFRGQPQVRDAVIGPGPGDRSKWWLRVQFHAKNSEKGREIIRQWLESTDWKGHGTLIKASYYSCRILRPKRGDIVFGSIKDVVMESDKGS